MNKTPRDNTVTISWGRAVVLFFKPVNLIATLALMALYALGIIVGLGFGSTISTENWYRTLIGGASLVLFVAVPPLRLRKLKIDEESRINASQNQGAEE